MLKPMFHTTSWIRRAGVAVFLLASLCTGTVALPHADGLDDFACSPVLVSLVNHDESAHYFGSAPFSRDSDGPHCFLCHSLRSFHPAFEKYQQRHISFRAERLHAAVVAFAECLEWSLAPGRAPPV